MIKTNDAILRTLLLSGQPLQQSRDGKRWATKKEGVDTHTFYYRQLPVRFKLTNGQVAIYEQDSRGNISAVSRRIRAIHQIQGLMKLAAGCRAKKKRLVLTPRITGSYNGFITQQGNVTIGCQKYPWSQIEPFMRANGWL